MDDQLDAELRRRLQGVAEQVLREVAAARPAREIAEHLEAGLLGVRDRVPRAQVGPLLWADRLLERVRYDLGVASAAREAGQRTMGIASGLSVLDIVLNGWQPGGLYILGGAPGVGKTSLALQWACQAVVDRRAVVVYLTYENSPQNLALKAIGRLAGVPPTAAERGRADPHRWGQGLERFRAIAPNLALVPADAGMSVDSVEAITREALAHRPGEGLLIVDYLQRMAYTERFESLRDNVSALAQRLRDLAVRLDLPVVAISALAPGRHVDEPLRLAALAERGELEYASDVVLLLGPRADVTLASAARAQAAPGLRLLDLLVAKNRYGEADRTIPVVFRPSTGDFKEEPTV